jgi:hypothetical protein
MTEMGAHLAIIGSGQSWDTGTGHRDASSRANLLRDAERVIDLNARRHGF